jgi:hypothetical protein
MTATEPAAAGLNAADIRRDANVRAAPAAVRLHCHPDPDAAAAGRGGARGDQVSSPCVPRSCTPRLTAPRREWREKQAEEIARRDAASKATRQETIARAEQSIDKFYEEYNGRKERTIRENKCGPPRRRCPTACADAAAGRRRRTTLRRSPTH